MKTTTHTLRPTYSSHTYVVDVTPKQSIRVRSTQPRYVPENGKTAIKMVEMDRTFKPGDLAEYGSYNLSYFGRITSIGPKTVTIVDYEGSSMEKTYRLSLERFAVRNVDFDADKAKTHNDAELMCL